MTGRPKAILQIGGSVLQANTINCARKFGLKILLTDSSAEPACLSAAAAFAQLDGTDADGIAAQAKAWSADYDIVLVHCGADFGLFSVAAAAKALGLPAADADAVTASLDKGKSAEIFKDAGLAVPARVRGAAPQRYPVIVKPTDSSGSRGVSFVDSVAELDAAIRLARRFSEDIVIEEWVAGRHIDVNGIMTAGEMLPCELIERYFSPFPDCFPVAMQTPPEADPALDRDAIFATVERAALALGITDGPVKADLIVDGALIYVLEIAPRFHGETNTYSAPLAYGTSSVEQFLKVRAGQAAPNPNPFTAATCIAGWIGLFADTPGVIANIDGVYDAETSEGIDKVLLRRAAGDTIKSTRDNTAVIGFIYGTAEDSAGLHARLSAAKRKIRVAMKGAGS